MSRLSQPLLAAALLAAAAAAQAAPEPQPFVRGTQQAIVSSFEGQPFVLALWSLDCVYCRHDLALLGRLQAERPDLKVVLIATDPPERRGEIAPALDGLRLDAQQSWIFADTFVERLRHEIDPQWFGELPRTYFYEADGSRTGISGSLDEAEVARWIRAAYAPAGER